MLNKVIFNLQRSQRLMPFSQRFMSVKAGDKVPSALISVVKYEEGVWTNTIVDT